jgi:hypothetical protein
MTMKGRLAALGVAAATLAAINDLLAPAIVLPLLAATIALAWRFAERFWKTVGFGLAGGVIAGALIMGPGFRLAMRAVAIMDPARTPEFSVGGTMFIILGIGGMLGGVLGIAGNLIRKTVPVRSLVVAGVVLAAMEMAMLLADPELREEFFALGAGPWVNVPMFAVFAIAYGIAAMVIASRLETQAGRRAVTERERVSA